MLVTGSRAVGRDSAITDALLDVAGQSYGMNHIWKD